MSRIIIRTALMSALALPLFSIACESPTAPRLPQPEEEPEDSIIDEGIRSVGRTTTRHTWWLWLPASPAVGHSNHCSGIEPCD